MKKHSDGGGLMDINGVIREGSRGARLSYNDLAARFVAFFFMGLVITARGDGGFAGPQTLALLGILFSLGLALLVDWATALWWMRRWGILSRRWKHPAMLALTVVIVVLAVAALGWRSQLEGVAVTLPFGRFWWILIGFGIAFALAVLVSGTPIDPGRNEQGMGWYETLKVILTRQMWWTEDDASQAITELLQRDSGRDPARLHGPVLDEARALTRENPERPLHRYRRWTALVYGTIGVVFGALGIAALVERTAATGIILLVIAIGALYYCVTLFRRKSRA